jgi:hypothetical protein
MLIPSKAMIANDYKTPLYVSDQKHADSIVPEHEQEQVYDPDNPYKNYKGPIEGYEGPGNW